ncbi:alanine dehydrogenase [Sulfuriflexus sp.]|uniref:alanine dehydrogenase n=1 Tax=Sulfuriflexus sp. TaxID=2015443 RepID=UPI0028CC15F4|nr:alanine dehydrogenase [Sulfuriflexus sp.]MDT8405292.1 alanine dehydrogenase [Sulfuriflexus sp.]
MDIGIPKEIKVLEGRVALVPAAVAELCRFGHGVFVETGAGQASGYSDAAYAQAGAQVVDNAAGLYAHSRLIVKVKEPVAGDLEHLTRDHIVFSYLHLAALPELTRELQAIGLTAIGFETIAAGRQLPLLAPMSDIAGRLAVQIGSNLLYRPQGGKGLLLGGLPGVERGRVVILGAGVAGGNAALVAAALGAEVTVFDRDREKLARMRALGGNVTGLHSYGESIAEAVRGADLLIGAILVPGKKATHLVSEAMVKSMQAGSVIVDIAVDQGGCIETTRPTDYSQPTFEQHGVTHFGVTNMPGAVPRSATQALSAAILPWLERLAAPGWREEPILAGAVNVDAGKVVHPALLG